MDVGTNTGGQVDWTIGRLLGWTCEHFSGRGLDEPRLCAEVLLAHALRCRRIELYTRFEEIPSGDPLATYRDHVQRAAMGEPIAYIVGLREFYSLEFAVSADVLIPRPETETLVEKAIDWCSGSGRAEPSVLEIGVGSGCVVVTILHQVRTARAVGTDVSSGAICVAGANAERHGVMGRLSLVVADKCDLPAGAIPEGGFDVMVSNPPYICEAEFALLDANVRDHEPRGALVAGVDGLTFYRAVAERGRGMLSAGGAVLVEIGAGMADGVAKVFSENPGWRAVGVYRSPPDPHDRVMHFEKV
jgi:release factor glutamine methyltransferase